MARDGRRQGPLDRLGLAGRPQYEPDAGVRLGAGKARRVIEVRGRPTDEFLAAVEHCLGLRLPTASPGTAVGQDRHALWMGPDRWWLLLQNATPEIAEIRDAIARFPGAVVEIGDSLAVVAISGPNARNVLAKGCTLDLHPRAYRPGHVAQTLLAKAQITLHQTAESEYEIYVRRSFAEYLWTWLEDAALEYGVTILGT